MKQSSSNTLSSQSGSITYRLQIRSAPTGPGLLCPALIYRLMIVSSCSRVLLDLAKFPFRCRVTTVCRKSGNLDKSGEFVHSLGKVGKKAKCLSWLDCLVRENQLVKYVGIITFI